MNIRKHLLTATMITGLTFALVGPASACYWDDGGHRMMGPGMMGPGMTGPGMMGPGMMEPGMMGPGMMGWGYGPQQQSNFNLSTDDVKSLMQRWVMMTGNPRLKVGPISEKDPRTITADIVTTDKDSLVQRFSVDRGTGWMQPTQ